MSVKNGGGLRVCEGNLQLKTLKKLNYKAFRDFSVLSRFGEVELSEYLEIYSGKEFLFMQTGKLWLYLFEKTSDLQFSDSVILGYAEITPCGEDVLEVGYFISPQYRKSGYGKKILQMAIKVCKNLDCKKITARVDSKNFPSVAILQGEGFEFCKKDDGENCKKQLSAFLDI